MVPKFSFIVSFGVKTTVSVVPNGPRIDCKTTNLHTGLIVHYKNHCYKLTSMQI